MRAVNPFRHSRVFETATKRGRLARLILAALWVACSLLGAGLAVTQGGPQTYHWQAFDVQVGIRPALHGQTCLLLPPLGTIRADTHRAPLALNMSLTGLSLEKIQILATHPPPRALLESDLERTARADAGDFVRREVGWGMLGGLLAPLLWRSRRARAWLGAALLGGGVTALLLLATYRTFDTTALGSPTYTGSLRQAAGLLGLARTAFNNARRLSDRLRGVAGELNTLYGRISAVSNLTPDGPTVRVLQITDIHNNGLAVSFVQELAKRFAVDAVINTGDLTDYGSPVEGRLSSGLAQIPVPTLFVAGNHDSQATVRAESVAPRTTVLDGQVVTVAGLTVLGEPDPSSARPGVGSVDTSDTALQAASARLATDVGRAAPAPDIVCVHNIRQAAGILGKAPVILCGHTHTASVTTNGITVICNGGTTGGAGTRYFDKPDGVPLTAMILTFTRTLHPRLLIIDQVSLDGSLNEFSITRRSFPPPLPSSPSLSSPGP